MNLFRDYLNEAHDREDENESKGLRIRYVGEREGLPEDIIALMRSGSESIFYCRKTRSKY